MSFVLAHLSDAHIGPLPRPRRRELIGKRLTGYLNWTRGRSRVHDMDVLAALVADIRARRPNHIAMTGDILNIGLKAEYPLARAWLETLGAPHDVSFVPGNHDAYVKATMPDLAATFAPWTTGDSGETYPYLRVRGNVALIGLSSGVPTPVFLASGRLGAPQCESCASLLSQCARDGLVRVVMIHHPPYRGGARLGRGLADAELFEAVIRRTGAELVIHGHNHRLSVSHLEGPSRKVPVIGVASASALRGTAGHRAGYNLFEIEGSTKSPRIKAHMRGLLPGGETIGALRPIAI
ncbi:MAG TPA: metallophosphoesterase [Methylovirgula sp.]|nr:metallophosphoesterase [Methylovirgula sp.]